MEEKVILVRKIILGMLFWGIGIAVCPIPP
jgi:hypothetical protein